VHAPTGRRHSVHSGRGQTLFSTTRYIRWNEQLHRHCRVTRWEALWEDPGTSTSAYNHISLGDCRSIFLPGVTTCSNRFSVHSSYIDSSRSMNRSRRVFARSFSLSCQPRYQAFSPKVHQLFWGLFFAHTPCSTRHWFLQSFCTGCHPSIRWRNTLVPS
jgi:hypothetical protein